MKQIKQIVSLEELNSLYFATFLKMPSIGIIKIFKRAICSYNIKKNIPTQIASIFYNLNRNLYYFSHRTKTFNEFVVSTLYYLSNKHKVNILITKDEVLNFTNSLTDFYSIKKIVKKIFIENDTFVLLEPFDKTKIKYGIEDIEDKDRFEIKLNEDGSYKVIGKKEEYNYVTNFEDIVRHFDLYDRNNNLLSKSDRYYRHESLYSGGKEKKNRVYFMLIKYIKEGYQLIGLFRTPKCDRKARYYYMIKIAWDFLKQQNIKRDDWGDYIVWPVCYTNTKSWKNLSSNNVWFDHIHIFDDEEDFFTGTEEVIKKYCK